MNTRLAFALIPLMLLPMVGFGSAHWTDSVKKNYYLHAGTVEVEIIWWHVEGTNTYDVDCDGNIWDDELKIIPVYDEEREVVKLDITVDPIYPCWFLDLEVIIHNKGRLSIKADDPMIQFTYENEPIPPQPYFQYFWHYYIWDPDIGEWIEVEPTTMVIKPSQVLRVKEFIHFIGQDYPELQCHWLDLHVEIPFFQYIGEEWSSLPSGPYLDFTEGYPPVVNCKWEQDLTENLEDGDPMHLAPGSQFLPPCVFEGKKAVQYLAVITDEEDRGDVKLVYADVYEPDGTFKYQVPMTKLAKPDCIDAFKAAAAAGLITYGLGHDYDSVLDQLDENLADVWMGQADLDYCQMAGDYDVYITAIDQDDNPSENLANTFLYVPVAACEIDFTRANYGSVIVCNEKWIDGDNVFGTADMPTIRNIGNSPVVIKIRQDNMGFGKDDNDNWEVEFDARLDLGTPVYYDPFENVTLPDILDRCQTEKLDFSIHVKKGTVGQVYRGMMYIWYELASPG